MNLDVVVNGCRAYVAECFYFRVYDISYFTPCPERVPRAPDSLTVRYDSESNHCILNWASVRFDTSGAALSIDRYLITRTTAGITYWIGDPSPPDTTIFIDSTAIEREAYYEVKAVKE
jgi:hypothetical protein